MMIRAPSRTLLRLVPVALLALAVVAFPNRGEEGLGDRASWAGIQQSSCGNAFLEPGEECDPPGSITCPPGSPAGAFQACQADCTCPAEAAALDHFQCYEVKPSNLTDQSVTVEDQFGTRTVRVRRAHLLCNPTDKNAEGIVDVTDHLVGYKTRGPRVKVLNQTVVNQFGTHLLDVVHPDLLMLPTGKDGVAQTPPLDHFQCYKVKRSRGSAKFQKRTVTISNQFETTTLEVTKPFRLCAPANKNGEDPTAPEHPDHLLCYKVRSAKFKGGPHTILNQFEDQTANVIARRELCLPSLKNPPPTTTTSTSIVTTTTSSTTTSTTIYGSPSRAFLVATPSLLD